MLRTMLKSKIHRATVTQADLHYVGSVTIDADLMGAADMLEGEQSTSPTANVWSPTRSPANGVVASSESTALRRISCIRVTS